MRPLLGSLILLHLAGSAAAQSGSIAGRAFDRQGSPVRGAAVRVLTTPHSARTDSSGRFQIDAIAAGEWQLRIAAVGFAPWEQRVTVVDGRATDLAATLEPAAVALADIEVRGVAVPGSVQPAPDITEGLILAGAKTEILQLAGTSVNLAEKNARQVFAKIPGVFVYDMDGSGNQINVATRGLDPHRSWELNVRQDGVMVNSDIYGYPASHYSLPLEAVERVEYVRGTAALQYGSQFGGMLNYQTRSPDPNRAAAVQGLTSAGSNGLWSGFLGAGGTAGKVSWYAYASVRGSNGYRNNAESDYNAEYLALSVPLSDKVTLRGQVGRSYYLYQIPGPLTDSMFEANPRTSTRSRNWFSPDIWVPALSMEWRPAPSTRVSLQTSGVFGARNSVQFVGFATVPDAIAPGTGEHAPRQVDIDNFRSSTTELRVTHDFALFGIPSTLATGLSYTNNDLHRRQQGVGTTGGDYDLTLTGGDFRRDVHYKTENVAVYAENLMRVTDRWSVIPGFRIEHGQTDLSGRLAYYDPADLPNSVKHDFPLFGLRSEFRAGDATELYAGWSQAYRPMILKDVLPENALERADPNMKDAHGWTLEAGVRGRLGTLRYDVTGFVLDYNDRFGTVMQTDPDGTQYLFKTNVGSSRTKGLELSLDLPVVTSESFGMSLFTATAFYDATYRKGTVVSGGENRNIEGNRVEAAPKWISRTGATATTRRLSSTLTFSYVGDSFSDPLNTTVPSANGAVGPVASYALLDLGFGVEVTRWLRMNGGITNLFDHQYFTKRPTFYPGPGVWSSDGRGVQLSADFRW